MTESQEKREEGLRRLDQEYHIRHRRYDLCHYAIREVSKWGALICIAYFIYLSIVSLSGKETLANIVVTLWAGVTGSGHFKTVAIMAVITISSLIWGLTERRLRHRTIGRFHDLREKYEIILDPDRTSSQLTFEGRTRPGDW